MCHSSANKSHCNVYYILLFTVLSGYQMMRKQSIVIIVKSVWQRFCYGLKFCSVYTFTGLSRLGTRHSSELSIHIVTTLPLRFPFDFYFLVRFLQSLPSPVTSLK
uniref:Uncharacterized protein n=1 Tax=Cacopsylla melanoneura TaxID=428564 RepID=A0A8D9ERZ5_9HEMI